MKDTSPGKLALKDRLRLARTRARLSQADLALRCGITQSAVSDLERGKSGVTAYVAQIATTLGVSALWLATGEGAMLPGDVAPVPVPAARVTNPSAVRADAYLDSAIVATEQALQAALVGSPAQALKIRKSLSMLREARVALLADLD